MINKIKENKYKMLLGLIVCVLLYNNVTGYLALQKAKSDLNTKSDIEIIRDRIIGSQRIIDKNNNIISEAEKIVNAEEKKWLCNKNQLFRVTENKKIDINFCDNQSYSSKISSMVNTIIPQAEASNTTVIEDLNLSNCRVTQYENSHIEHKHGSVYATDIACDRGKSFSVYVPKIKNIFVIEYIGENKYLGNYVIIKHGDLRWVYGHTITNYGIGKTLYPGEELGYTNISGVSENYHLHIELWKGYDNISFKYTKGEGLDINPNSYKLREQRNLLTDKEINDKAFEFISKYEGCHLDSYWDGKQWSVGYGSKSYEGEKISQEEATKRLRIRIQDIRTKYNLSVHSTKVQVAVSSFVYNIGSIDNDQKWLLSNHYYKALGNDFKRYVKAGGKKLGGLVTRRYNESELLHNL